MQEEKLVDFMGIEDILTEIVRQTKIPKDELMSRINKKQEELSGLVSLEGAAHLVARELGIDLLNEKKRRLEMKNIVSGMKNVSVVGRIFKISDLVEFKRKDGSEGKVVNLFLSDNTDYIRLPLWNDQTKLIEDGSISLGDTIQIVNGLAKENIFGNTEISLGRYGSIKPIEDIELPSTEELAKRFLFPSLRRVLIKDISLGRFEIKANIAHVFRGKFLFDICPFCGGTLENKKCLEHGEVKPDKALVISCIVDDGTGNIRAVFFREQAEKICKLKANELFKLEQEKRYELIKESLIGKDLILNGRVRKNKMFDRTELLVSSFKDLSILEESKKLAEEIEMKFTTGVGGKA